MLRVVIWELLFWDLSQKGKKNFLRLSHLYLLHTQSQQLVSFQNFLLMTQGWWIQWTTYYMMTPWMRCLEYQALCLLHFIWEQLQQKTSQQSIQHSRWQLFVSIFFPFRNVFQSFLKWHSVCEEKSYCDRELNPMINSFWDMLFTKNSVVLWRGRIEFLVHTWLKKGESFILKKYLVKMHKNATPKMILLKYVFHEISWSMK